MNDYIMIKQWDLNACTLTPEVSSTMFQTNKKFILEQLKEEVPSIVLSHHGASNISNGKYIGGEMQSAFATDIPELSDFKHLIACFNGHTHQSMNTLIPGTHIKLLSNCYGYPGEKTDFDYNAVFEVL